MIKILRPHAYGRESLNRWTRSGGQRDRRKALGVPHVPRSPTDWAGQLANADVDETVALRWGGWNDLETFLDHYRGETTEKAKARERAKVDLL